MGEKIEVTMTIDATKGITGQQIMNAVKQLAGDGFVVNQKVHDDRHFYKIGRSSSYPYKDCVVAVGALSEWHLNPLKTYYQLEVKYHPWPGVKYCVGYTDDAVVKSVRQFRDALKSELGLD